MQKTGHRSERIFGILNGLLIKPVLQVSLGAAFSAALSVLLAFYPFPQGKIISFSMIPVVVICAFLLDRFMDCSVILTTTIVNVIKRKTFLQTAILVHLGMILGALYVASVVRTIDKEKNSTEGLFQENMYLALNESIESRLKQTGILTLLFYFTTHAALWVRVVFYFLSIVWIPTVPDINPAIAYGWFQGSSKFDETQLMQFWVNSFFVGIISWFITLALSFTSSFLRWTQVTKLLGGDKKNKTL